MFVFSYEVPFIFVLSLFRKIIVGLSRLVRGTGGWDFVKGLRRGMTGRRKLVKIREPEHGRSVRPPRSVSVSTADTGDFGLTKGPVVGNSSRPLSSGHVLRYMMKYVTGRVFVKVSGYSGMWTFGDVHTSFHSILPV